MATKEDKTNTATTQATTGVDASDTGPTHVPQAMHGLPSTGGKWTKEPTPTVRGGPVQSSASKPRRPRKKRKPLTETGDKVTGQVVDQMGHENTPLVP